MRGQIIWTAARTIQLDVCRRYEISLDDMLGPCRRKSLVAARYEAINAVRKELGFSTPRLGKIFRRDHTTILHALGRIKNRYRKKSKTEAIVP